jgi:hypothetical protein
MKTTAAAHPGKDTPVDFGRNFMPEELTPLFYVPLYRQLAPEHRLRYNQLQALYFNEQIIFFETMIGRGVMGGLLRQTWTNGFGEKLQRFSDDEIRHSEMFRQLNRLCAPQRYAAADFHFIQAPRRSIAALRWMTRRPRVFPLFIWLMLLQEERSLYYSREFIRHVEAIEPHFVASHRVHLADEANHVRWDEELLDRLWRGTSRLLRVVNARLFAWMLGEFFSTPKRGQLRVVEMLAREFPELRERETEMSRQLLALPRDETYQLSIYSRRIVPRCFAQFDRWPELRVMERAIRGYRFLPKEAL